MGFSLVLPPDCLNMLAKKRVLNSRTAQASFHGETPFFHGKKAEDLVATSESLASKDSGCGTPTSFWEAFPVYVTVE